MHILFVCTGNTCRSPMAAALLYKIAADDGQANRIIVSSAGLAGGAGGASMGAATVMRERGLDLSLHQSRQVNRGHIAAADLVLAMTEGQKRALQAMAPEGRDKIHTLAEFAGMPGADVPDPFGADIAMYRRTADRLEDMLRRVWEKIRKQAG